MNVRTAARILAVIVLAAGLSACASHPSWIHRLPEGIQERPTESRALLGVWDRVTYSRFGVASRIARSGGRESIAFHKDEADQMAYRKTHVYREVSAGKELLRYYVEEGAVIFQGPLVLLAAKTAQATESRWDAERDLETSWKRLMARPIPDTALTKQNVPKPLLFYYHAPDLLIPFAYERGGKVYDFGIYEGTTEPFETSSPGFREAVRRYTDKQFHNHAYHRDS